ncbi:MAG TPA: alpha/beta fold hydrolase [Candidatus Thermoplasmatota archaeon]|nr:alpha/beta fold hydrolase [Candidatus Thermoplasmatota archaeon]
MDEKSTSPSTPGTNGPPTTATGPPNPAGPSDRPTVARRGLRPRYKWTIVAAGVVVGLLIVATLAISWISGQSLLHPEREQTAQTPASVGLPWTWANFTTEDRVDLVGWWMPSDGSPDDNATVIFLHGYTDAKNQSLAVAPFLHAAGYNVLAFDFRAQGYSGGDFASAGILEVRDVRAAIAWLKVQPGFPADPDVALFGWSMGGATGLSAAPDLPEVDAIIADGSFSKLQNIVDTSIVHFIKKQIGFGVPRWPIGPLSVTFAAWSVGLELDGNPPVAAIAKFDGPILLIQGTADDRVFPFNAAELVSAGGDNVELVEIQGAKHVACLDTDPERYGAAVVGFLAAAFAN